LASHGNHAVELYRRHGPSIAVVLLDVVMPGMDGPTTLLALQKLNPGLHACFMTGDAGKYTEDYLLGLGAVKVFHKPFSLEEVIQTIHELARRSPPQFSEQSMNWRLHLANDYQTTADILSGKIGLHRVWVRGQDDWLSARIGVASLANCWRLRWRGLLVPFHDDAI
jgi:CheY-like chemotaxis protein